MDYDEEKSATGTIPEFGAIFMASTLTKKECFKRRVFALPASKAEFVKHVKDGMVLFLFEFERRQLFGVFQASGNGGMDIVPDGFNYSGVRFRAQVRFTPIWCCNPLSEKEFKGAIRENYFSPKKFNFGLSKAQVHRLISLFSSRKLKTNLPPQLVREVADKAAIEDRRLVGDADLAISDRATDFKRDYQGSSLNRETVDEILPKDAVNSKGKAYLGDEVLFADSHGAFLSKRKRVNSEDESYMYNETKHEVFNDWRTSRSSCVDPAVHSLDEVRRSVDGRRLLQVDMGYNENQVDNNINPGPTSRYPLSPLRGRTSDYDQFTQRNRSRSSDYNLDNAYGQALESEHYGEPLNAKRHAVDHDSFWTADSARREYNIRDIEKSVELGDGQQNLYAQARELVDDHQYAMNGKLEYRYHLHSDDPVSVSQQFRSPLNNLRKTTTGYRLPMTDRIVGEPDFGTYPVAGFSSENITRPLRCDDRTMFDGQLPMEGRGTEDMIGSILSSGASNMNSKYIASADEQLDDFGRFRLRERAENFEGVNTFDRPSFFSKLKETMSPSSNKYFPETGLSRLSAAQNFDPSRLAFGDSTITRAVPYIPELPAITHGSSSLAADWNSSSVQEKHPYHGSGERFYSLSESLSSSFPLEPHKPIKSMDLALDYVNRSSLANLSSLQSPMGHKTTGSFLNSNLSMERAPNTSAPPVDYRDPIFSLPSAHSNGDKLEEENILFSYPSGSGKNNLSSQHMSEYVPRHPVDMLADKDFIRSEAKDFTGGEYHPEKRGLRSYDNQDFRFCRERRKISEAPPSHSTVSRKSVFSRLKFDQEAQVDEERKDPNFNDYDRYMSASADEVMEMLQQQGNNLQPRKKREFGAVGRPKRVEGALDEKHSQAHSSISQSTMEKKKLKDAYPVTTESNDEAPKETRIVDFRRRGETKKSMVETVTDPVEAQNNATRTEGVTSPAKEILKRRKLVRPVFGKNEPGVEGKGNDQKLQCPSLIHDKGDKQNCRKDIRVHKANMANDKVKTMLDSNSHQLYDSNTNEHSYAKEENSLEAHLLPSLSNDHEKGPKLLNDGLQTGSLQVFHKKTIEPKGISPRTLTSILSQEIDSRAESLKLEESCSGGPRLEAVSENPREEKNAGMLRRKRKMISSKKGMECSQ